MSCPFLLAAILTVLLFQIREKPQYFSAVDLRLITIRSKYGIKHKSDWKRENCIRVFPRWILKNLQNL